MAGQFVRRTFYTVSKRNMPPPDRWDVYSPIGKVIAGTKFIAFKVPLKEELMMKVQEEHRFSPSILIKRIEDQGLKLGGVIDLTFTHKYYNKDEFLQASIEHKKILTKGHDVPSEDVFQEFAHAVKAFEEIGHLIGVHCTHGVNRTGYLICRYMIEKMDMEPEEAINLFNEARGHRLERENYLHDLKRRIKGRSSTGEAGFDPRQKPRKPRWRHHREDHPGWRQQKQRDVADSDNVANRYTERHDMRQYDMECAWHKEWQNHADCHEAAGNWRGQSTPGSSRIDRRGISERGNPRWRGDSYGNTVWRRDSYQNNGRDAYRNRTDHTAYSWRNPLANHARGRFYADDSGYDRTNRPWPRGQDLDRRFPGSSESYPDCRTFQCDPRQGSLQRGRQHGKLQEVPSHQQDNINKNTDR